MRKLYSENQIRKIASEAGGTKLYRHDICLDGYEGDNYQIYFTLIDQHEGKYTQATLKDAIKADTNISVTGWYGGTSPTSVFTLTSNDTRFSFKKLEAGMTTWTDVLWTTSMLSVTDKVSAL